MKTKITAERIDYTGSQLRSHWLMERFEVDGDAIVAFSGSCNVSGDHLVDREDFRLGNTVAGDNMLHFIAEVFGVGLIGIVFAQRVLCGIAREVINSRSDSPAVKRYGDDLYVGEGKLSVSVATISPVSGLIHLGLNITGEGVPVRAATLDDLGIDPWAVAEEVVTRFAEEMDSCFEASRKVRPVM